VLGIGCWVLGECLAVAVSVGGLSVGELSLVDEETSDEDVLQSLKYFQSSDEFVTGYVYLSVCLLQPLYSDNDITTDWALSDNWLPFLRRMQSLHIVTCQINCTASHRYHIHVSTQV